MKNIVLMLLLCVLGTGNDSTARESIDCGDSVVIIGAGISGAVAAYELSKQGISSLIFDKSEEVGGKCRTYNYNDAYPIDQGPIQIASYYNETRAYMDEFQMASFPSPAPVSANPDNPIDMGFWKFLKLEKYAWEAKKYDEIHADRTAIEKYPELMVTAQEYIEKNNLTELNQLFTIFMHHYGYGKLSEVPIYDLFSILPPEGVQNLIMYKTVGYGKPISLVADGYKKLVERLLEDSKAEIRLGEAVEKMEIDVDQSGMVTLWTQGGQYKAKRVIVTVPPSDHLPIFYSNGSDQQDYQFIKESITQHAYGTTIFSIDQPLASKLFINFGFEENSPTMIGAKFIESETAISYAYGSNAEKKSITRSLLDFYPILKQGSITSILAQEQWDDYYPHPTLESVKKGFYSKLRGLQDRNPQVVYCGSWETFELIERSIRSTHQALKRYFNVPIVSH